MIGAVGFVIAGIVYFIFNGFHTLGIMLFAVAVLLRIEARVLTLEELALAKAPRLIKVPGKKVR